jgi:hypothetical protein
MTAPTLFTLPSAFALVIDEPINVSITMGMPRPPSLLLSLPVGDNDEAGASSRAPPLRGTHRQIGTGH